MSPGVGDYIAHYIDINVNSSAPNSVEVLFYLKHF